MMFIRYSYQGNLIHQRISDGYINLTEIAKANGQQIDSWMQLEKAKELFAEFERQQMELFPEKPYPLFVLKENTYGGTSGTYVHPDIAIVFAQWCSPKFYLQVCGWIREWTWIQHLFQQPSHYLSSIEEMFRKEKIEGESIFQEVCYIIRDLEAEGLPTDYDNIAYSWSKAGGDDPLEILEEDKLISFDGKEWKLTTRGREEFAFHPWSK